MIPLKKRLPQLIYACLLAAVMIAFLTLPARYGKSVREGVSLWAVSVLPATLPFLFLTALFTRLRLFPKLAKATAPAAEKLFAVSGTGACAALLSVLSGYPVGARTVLDLCERGAIAKEERFRLACLCSTTGPMFLVGAVGANMFCSAAAGWVLFASHLSGVWTGVFLLRLFSRKQTLPRTLPLSADRGGNALSESLYSSVISVLCVGGAIAIFYAVGQMVADLLSAAGMGGVALAVARGLLEMTAGCALLAPDATALNMALCAFLVTFGGTCILVQQLAFLQPAGVKALPFLAVKLLQGTLAAAFCLLFSLAL